MNILTIPANLQQVTAPDIALARVLPDLRDREARMRVKAATEGISYGIAPFGWLRTQADTTRILSYRDADYAVYVASMKKAGKTPVSINAFRPIQPFGNSYHNYGGAFDVLITHYPSTLTPEQALTRLGGIGATVGLVWGGLWGAGQTDRPHFQLPGGLPDIRARWAALQTPAPRTEQLSTMDVALPGASVIASRLPDVPALRVPANLARMVPVPSARAAVTTGALVVAGLLLYAIARRMLGGRS